MSANNVPKVGWYFSCIFVSITVYSFFDILEHLSAVLFYDVVNLVPDKVCTFLVLLAHLHKWGSDHAACSRMLAKQTVGAGRFLALNVSGKCLSIWDVP